VFFPIARILMIGLFHMNGTDCPVFIRVNPQKKRACEKQARPFPASLFMDYCKSAHMVRAALIGMVVTHHHLHNTPPQGHE
jgi:hypothetical protein